MPAPRCLYRRRMPANGNWSLYFLRYVGRGSCFGGIAAKRPSQPLEATGQDLPQHTGYSGAHDRNESYQKTERLAVLAGAFSLDQRTNANGSWCRSRVRAPSADRGRADRGAPAIGAHPAWRNRHRALLPREQRLGALDGILPLPVNGNDSRARPAKESTMTSKTRNAKNRPLDDHELDLICGGFFLMEELVTIKEVAIIIGMHVPAVQKVRNP